MDKQECKDTLLARKVDVIDKHCIGFIQSCVEKLAYWKSEISKKDEECITLLRVASSNLGFFNDKGNAKIASLKSNLSKMYDSEKINKANLEQAKNNLASFEEQKKQNEQKVGSLKLDLENINAGINKKKQEIDELNKKHSSLLQEKKNFEDQKTGKDAAVSKLLADENNAQNSINHASNEHNFVANTRDRSNPCFHDPSPHLYDNCIQQYKNKINEKQGIKDQITAQKNQAVNELNSINSQIQNKINEISALKSSLSTHQQEFNDLVGRQTLRNNELNSMDLTVTETTQNIANEHSQITEFGANSQAKDIALKEQELHQSKLYLSDLVMLSDDINKQEFSQFLGVTMDNAEL